MISNKNRESRKFQCNDQRILWQLTIILHNKSLRSLNVFICYIYCCYRLTQCAEYCMICITESQSPKRTFKCLDKILDTNILNEKITNNKF